MHAVSSWPLRWSLAILLGFAANSATPGAIVTTGDINFSTTLGPGATFSFDESTTLGVEFFAEFFFNRGTRTIRNTSRIQAEFPAQLGAPGTATINLSQIPISSAFTTQMGITGEIGARANTPIGPAQVSQQLGMGIVANGSGLGTLTTITGTGNDVAEPAPSFGIPFGILEAVAGIRADMTRTVDYAALNGTLFYQNRDTLAIGMLPFQIDSSFALHPLDVVLDEPGIYDFQIFGPSITGTIDSHLVFSVSIFATIFGNNTPDLRIPFAPFDSSDAYTAASGFLINDWFSIEVLAPPSDPPAGVVPEPASCVVWMALAAMGGAVIRRGPRRATEKKAAKS